MSGEYVGSKNYALFVPEVTWGTNPGSMVHIPVRKYGVKMAMEHFQTPNFVGLLQAKHGQKKRGLPTGSIEMGVFGWTPSGASKSLMEYMLDWLVGASLEAMETPSCSWFWAEGPNKANKVHTGMRVSGFSLSGGDGQPVTLSVNTSGQDQDDNSGAGSASALPSSREKIVEALSEDCSLTIGGSSLPVKGWTWSVERQMAVSYEGNKRPQLLLAKSFRSTLTIIPRKTADTWDARENTDSDYETTGVLNIQALHNGTGTGGTSYTKAAITFNRLQLQSAGDEGGDDIQYQPLEFLALKPDTSSATLSYAITEV